MGGVISCDRSGCRAVDNTLRERNWLVPEMGLKEDERDRRPERGRQALIAKGKN